MPDHDHDRRGGQRRERRRPAAEHRSQAREPDEQRGPHDGRLGSHEHGVEPRAHGDGDERPRPPHGRRAQHAKQTDRQNPHVQPRNREHVDRARDEKLLGVLRWQRLAAAEQERRGQPGSIVHMPLERRGSSGPDTIEPGHRRPCRRPTQHPHTLARLAPNDRQAAPGPGPLAKVELARIERVPGPEPAAQDPHPCAAEHGGGLPHHDHGRPPRRRLPGRTSPDLRHGHHALGRWLDRQPAGRRRGRGRQRPWRLDHHALDRHRHRCLCEAPCEVIAPKEPLAGHGPAPGHGSDRHQQRGCGCGRAGRPQEPRPEAPRGYRCQPAAERGAGGVPGGPETRESRPTDGPQERRPRHHDERPPRQRLMPQKWPHTPRPRSPDGSAPLDDFEFGMSHL